MTRSVPLWLAAAGALALSGCASSPGGTVPYAPVDFGPPDQETVPTAPIVQTIVPTDKVKVTVFQEPELSGEYEVDAGGQIDFPLLGQLEIEGSTPAEVSELIRTRLSQRFLRNPRVQVAVTDAAARTITVEGSVGQSGIYPIEGPTTLIRAIALARGTRDDANDARVLIFRTVDGQQMAAAFDLTAIRRAESPDPPVYGNDVIVVPGSRSRAIWREVLSTLPVLGMFRPF